MYGISQLINVVLGVIRSKITALLLGTVGIGVIGLYQSVIDITRATTNLGLDTGAVKKVAVINSSEGNELSKTLYSVNVWYLFTAILGALVCVVFAEPFSMRAFGSTAYTLHITLLSIAILFVSLSAGLIACLQGMRKISYMAMTSSIGSLLSLLIMIPIYYYWGIEGVIPVYIVANVIVFLVSLYFYKKVKIKFVRVPLKEVYKIGKEMVGLGLYIVAAGILSTGSLFIVRIFLSGTEGLGEVGLFQAAWLTSTLISGIVLRSANSDFFPKLCSLSDSKSSIRSFINEQTYILLLIISPLTIGLITFTEYVIYILYSSEFLEAIDTFRWYFIAIFIKMVATPTATVMLAKSRGGLYLICEIVYWGIFLLACYLLFPLRGLEGVGLSCLVAYMVYLPLVLTISARISDVAWNFSVVFTFLVNVLLIAGLYFVYVYYNQCFLIFGTSVLLLTAFYSYRQVKSIIGIEEIIRRIKNKRGR